MSASQGNTTRPTTTIEGACGDLPRSSEGTARTSWVLQLHSAPGDGMPLDVEGPVAAGWRHARMVWLGSAVGASYV